LTGDGPARRLAGHANPGKKSDLESQAISRHTNWHMKRNQSIDVDLMAQALAPFKHDAWRMMTPFERMRRCLRMRRLIPNLRKIHDQKLFPAIEGG